MLFSNVPLSHVQKFQLVHFLSLSTNQLLIGILQYTITSEDITSPSHFMIDFSCLGDEIHFQNVSTQYMLRLVSDPSTFTQMETLNPGLWDAEAYSTQIIVDASLLTHAAGLVVQVEDAETLPMCIIERQERVPSVGEILITGPCSHTELHMAGRLDVIIYKPYKRHCCRLEATVVHTQSNQGMMVFKVLYKDSDSITERADLWDVSENSLNIKLNVICNYVACIGILFSIYTVGGNSTHDTTLAYRASLYPKSYFSHESVKQSLDWQQVCLKYTCYLLPMRQMVPALAWNDAKEECENKNASLLSINSDSEWRLLSELFQHYYQLIYIGLKIKVSRNTYDFIK